MPAISYFLMAEPSRGESFREGFRNRGAAGHDDVLLGLLIVATLIAGVWAVSRLVGLRRRRRGYNSPWRLFWALAKAHHLTWSESWLLRRVARDQGIRHPGRLFLESQLWDEKGLGSRFALELPRLKTLRKRIFGVENDASAEPAVRQPVQSARPVAPPLLFPSLPSPTLDIPPWTAER